MSQGSDDSLESRKKRLIDSLVIRRCVNSKCTQVFKVLPKSDRDTCCQYCSYEQMINKRMQQKKGKR